MNLNIFTKTLTLAVLGFAILFGTSEIALAQGNRNDRNNQRDQQKTKKQQQETQKKQQEDRKRQVKKEDQNIKKDHKREQKRIRELPKRTKTVVNNRYRVNRNGKYYETNNRGAELLRHAVNTGYQEGYRAGRNDRHSRRKSNYLGSSIYRKGNYGYQNYVASSQYQYYFQQGFQKGYDDGFYNRYEYGTNNEGSLNILGNILQSILNIESY